MLIMVAAHANNGRPTINYSHMLIKLKADLREPVPKKPRNAKTLYPTEIYLLE